MDQFRNEKGGFAIVEETGPLLKAREDAENWESKPRKSSRARLFFLVPAILLGCGLLAVSCLSYAGKASNQSAPISPSKHMKRTSSAAVCTSDLCKTFADQIKSNFAKNYATIDPCVDLDAYACDGWRDTHDFRPEQNEIGTFTTMEDNNQNLLKQIVESPYNDKTSLTGEQKVLDKANFDKMKLAYDSCMNEDAIKAAGVAPLQKILEEFEKQYPVTAPAGAQKSSKDELTSTLIWLAQHLFSELVSVSILTNPKNPKEIGLFVSGEDDADLSKEDFKKTAIVANYTRAVAEMTETVRTGKPVTQVDAAALASAKKITDFQGKLAKIVPDQEALSDLTAAFDSMTLADLDKLVPEISISKFLLAQAPPGLTITKVGVYNSKYFKALASILKATDRKTMHDYFQWGLTRALTDGIHKDFLAPLNRFESLKAGKPIKDERWKTCLAEIDSELGWIESAFFVQRSFGREAKEFGERIISDIKDVFVEKLQAPEWMSADAKAAALNKVKKMGLKIGYSTTSPNVLDPKSISDWYKGMKISQSRFQNMIEFNRFKHDKSWNDLLKPADPNRWTVMMPATDGGYEPLRNEISYPAGYMQLPGFALGLPEYISYSGFGSSAGNDVLHGFDRNGSKTDAAGLATAGWDTTTIANYEKKTTCFVDQFNKFTVPGLGAKEILHVNGTLTRDENVADAAGLSTAFAAWQKRNKAAPNQGLPGLEKYTNEQLFFLSYASSSCGKRRPADQVKALSTEPHSPAKIRTIGALANSGPFKQAFNCPVKQPTCALW